ncbi:MAG: hypothetical protein ACD_24C00517G0004, partial [uncultured bacterium]
MGEINRIMLLSFHYVGVWRSWLAHQYGVLGVGGSNPL